MCKKLCNKIHVYILHLCKCKYFWVLKTIITFYDKEICTVRTFIERLK